MSFNMEIIILLTIVFYIIFCKLAFKLNFKYKRKIDNCLLLEQSVLIMLFVIKSVIANTMLIVLFILLIHVC